LSPAGQASLSSFPLDKSGKRAFHAHFVRIAEEDRGDKRVRKIVQHFSAEFALNEFGQSFFLRGWLGRAKDLGQDAPLGSEPD
jgi:hypothetical protein